MASDNRITIERPGFARLYLPTKPEGTPGAFAETLSLMVEVDRDNRGMAWDGKGGQVKPAVDYWAINYYR